MNVNKAKGSHKAYELKIPNVKKIAVNGACNVAATVKATPKIIKFKIIISGEKYVFAKIPTIKPKHAPEKILGAKTPPSPPSFNVSPVVNGLIRIRIKVRIAKPTT